MKVCDMPMGFGKTSAAIDFIKSHPENNYLYVTPYLSECERIIDNCSTLNFRAPDDTAGTKTENFMGLLSAGSNIVTTHTMFSIIASNQKMIKSIDLSKFILIVDESPTVVHKVPISRLYSKFLKDNHYIEIGECGAAVPTQPESHFPKDSDLYTSIKPFYDYRMYEVRESMYVGVINPEIFSLFKDVYILTYLFDAQVFRYYCDVFNIPFSYLRVRKEHERYTFYRSEGELVRIPNLNEKITIVQHAKVNQVGDDPSALSSAWYAKQAKSENGAGIIKLHNMIDNFFRRQSAQKDDRMWATFSKYAFLIGGSRYKTQHLAGNTKGTNRYSNRHYLAYLVNVFIDPLISDWIEQNGLTFDKDKYALSELIQWVFRSALRNGEHITLLLPSLRMRTLFCHWVREVSGISPAPTYNELLDEKFRCKGPGGRPTKLKFERYMFDESIPVHKIFPLKISAKHRTVDPETYKQAAIENRILLERKRIAVKREILYKIASLDRKEAKR